MTTTKVKRTIPESPFENPSEWPGTIDSVLGNLIMTLVRTQEDVAVTVTKRVAGGFMVDVHVDEVLDSSYDVWL